MDGIFISYRRDDSAGYAGRLYDRLIPRFGAARVFMDVEGIELGADFVTAIEDAVGSCRVLVVIIGDEWLSTQDAAGRRRLDDPHDFIRLETVTALTRGIRVVPVLVGGALMPRAEELPDDLKPLARRQAIEISHKQWEATTDELIRALDGMLGMGGEPAAPPPPEETSRPVPLAVLPEPEEARGKGNRKAVAVGVAVVALIVGGGFWGLMWPGDEDDSPSTQAGNEPLLTAQAPPSTPVRSAGTTAVAAAPAPAAAATTGPTSPPVAVAAAPAPPATVVAAAPPTRTLPAPAAATRPVAAVAAARPAAIAPQRATPVEPTAAVVRAVPEATRPVDTALPRVGESWTYRTSGKWPTSPSRSIVIAVQSVNNGVVTDSLRADGLAADVRRSAGSQPAFMSWDGIGTEFSPYLAAYNDLTSLGTLRGFPTPDMPPSWSQWYSEAKVVGQETVTVPAGSFQAHKVEVWSSRRATGGPTLSGTEPVRVQYLIWYAAPAKRYVKMQRRVISASGQESERDVFELAARR